MGAFYTNSSMPDAEVGRLLKQHLTQPASQDDVRKEVGAQLLVDALEDLRQDFDTDDQWYGEVSKVKDWPAYNRLVKNLGAKTAQVRGAAATNTATARNLGSTQAPPDAGANATSESPRGTTPDDIRRMSTDEFRRMFNIKPGQRDTAPPPIMGDRRTLLERSL